MTGVVRAVSVSEGAKLPGDTKGSGNGTAMATANSRSGEKYQTTMLDKDLLECAEDVEVACNAVG